jgi:hypothetical protein
MTHTLSRITDARSIAALNQLAALVQAHKVVPFIGAGISKAADFPLWDELVRTMEAAAFETVEESIDRPDNAQQRFAGDPLSSCDRYRRVMGEDRYSEILHEVFGLTETRRAKVEHSPHFQSLAELRFEHWLTTNYDLSLEYALTLRGMKPVACDWSDRDSVNQFLLKAPRSQGPLCIHVHGHMDDAASVILTEEDYQNRYWRSDEDRIKLILAFTSNTVLFVGCSLKDEDLLSILREVKAKLGLTDPRHYALLAQPADKWDVARLDPERLKVKFGITPIFYETDPHHAGLVEALKYLSHPQRRVTPPKPQQQDLLDPEKGRWGWLAERDGFKLSAEVRESRFSHDWFDIDIAVTGPAGTDAEGLAVRYHLHPTFPRPIMDAPFHGDVAHLKVGAYGAFTVGAEVLAGESVITALELDLSQLEEAPLVFRSR